MKHESRTKHAKRNIAGAFLNKGVTILLTFLTRTAIIYCLGSLYMGLNSLFTSVLQILSLAELGFGSAMVFSMYEPIAKGDDEAVCALLKLYRSIYRVIGTVVLVIGLSLMPFLKVMIKGQVPDGINLYVLYLINLLNTVMSYFLFAYKGSLLSANQRNDITSVISVAMTIICDVVQIILLVWLHNYYAYCIVLPIITVIKNLVTSVICDRLFPQYVCAGQIERKVVEDIKKRVAGLFIYKVCGVFRNSFDSIIISAFLGLAILGKYNNYYYIVSAVTSMLNMAVNSIVSGIGNSIVKESKEKNFNDFRKFQFLYMWIVGVCTVLLVCLYQPFMLIWVKADMMLGNSMMFLFCLYFWGMHVSYICYTYRQAAGLWWQDKVRPIVETFANLGLNIILVKTLGVSGVLLSTLLCLFLINAGWGAKVLFKYYFTDKKISSYFLRIVIYGAATFAACVVSYTICSKLTVGGWIGIILYGIIAFVCSNVILWITLHKLPEYRDTVGLCKQIIKRS
jgi:O-antigen/teichoic acid export membrane protein